MAEKVFAIKQKFSSYLDFHQHIEKYEQSSGYRLATGDSSKRKGALEGSDFEFAYKVYKCEKSGISKSKGKGIRNRTSLKTNCPFYLRIKYTTKKNQNPKEFLEITQLNLIHNHPSDCEPVNTSLTADQPLLFTCELNVFDKNLVLDDTNKCYPDNASFVSDQLSTASNDLAKDQVLDPTNADILQSLTEPLSPLKGLNDPETESISYCTKKCDGSHALSRDNVSSMSEQPAQDSATHVLSNSTNAEPLRSLIGSNNPETDPISSYCTKKCEGSHALSGDYASSVDQLAEDSATDDYMNKSSIGNEPLQSTDSIVTQSLLDSTKKNLHINNVQEVQNVIEEKKSRGRPKGATKIVIGLPIKAHENIVFTKLSEKGQLKRILEWLNIQSSIIQLVLNGEYLIKYCDIEEKLKNLCNSFIDENVNLSLFQNFFEPKAFRFFKIAVLKLRTNPIYTCKICNARVTEDDESIACDGCLMWMHTKCIGIRLTKKVQNSNWFCSFCLKK